MAKDLGGRAVAQDVLPDRPGKPSPSSGSSGDRRPGPLADRDDAARIASRLSLMRAGATARIAASRSSTNPIMHDPRQPADPATRLEPGVAAGGDELVLHRASGGDDLAQRPRCQDFPLGPADGAWISSTACMSRIVRAPAVTISQQARTSSAAHR